MGGENQGEKRQVTKAHGRLLNEPDQIKKIKITTNPGDQRVAVSGRIARPEGPKIGKTLAETPSKHLT